MVDVSLGSRIRIVDRYARVFLLDVRRSCCNHSSHVSRAVEESMKCGECRGACCESICIPLFDNPTGNFLINENNRWLAAHGTLDPAKEKHTQVFDKVAPQNIMTGDRVKLEVRCTKLTDEGECSIYKERPLPCVLYEPGGPDCLATVKARRTAEDYQRIRDDRDPRTIHN